MFDIFWFFFKNISRISPFQISIGTYFRGWHPNPRNLRRFIPLKYLNHPGQLIYHRKSHRGISFSLLQKNCLRVFGKGLEKSKILKSFQKTRGNNFRFIWACHFISIGFPIGVGYLKGRNFGGNLIWRMAEKVFSERI